MKYIKGPVQICDSEFPNLYYIRDANGDRITIKLPLELAREITAALNAHDALVAERDELKAKLAELTEALSLRWQWGKKED